MRRRRSCRRWRHQRPSPIEPPELRRYLAERLRGQVRRWVWRQEGWMGGPGGVAGEAAAATGRLCQRRVLLAAGLVVAVAAGVVVLLVGEGGGGAAVAFDVELAVAVVAVVAAAPPGRHTPVVVATTETGLPVFSSRRSITLSSVLEPVSNLCSC